MEVLLTTLGSVASIAAAVWAFYEATEASKSATKAESMRDELIDRRKIIEVSEVHKETKRILSIVSKVGPSSNPTLLTGIDGSAIAKDVEEYSRMLNEHSAHFSEHFQNRARELCEELNDDIEGLSEANSPADKKDFGIRIYYKINDFLPLAKEIADKRKENVSVRG